LPAPAGPGGTPTAASRAHDSKPRARPTLPQPFGLFFGDDTVGDRRIQGLIPRPFDQVADLIVV